MAARFSAGVISAATVNAGASYAEMIAGATRPISVREVRVMSASALGGHVALVRASSVGTGSAAGIATAVNHRIGTPTSSARLQGAWAQAPTGYVTPLRREIIQAATGANLSLWRLDDGPLVVEPGQSLLVINGGSGIQGGAQFVNFTWEEGPISDS